MFDGKRECDGSSQGMADQKRPFQAQRLDETTHQISLLGQPPGRASGARGIAGTGTIERDQPVARPHAPEQRMPELVQLRAKAMQEDDRPALARLDIVDAVAVDVDKFSRRRDQPFGPDRDQPGNEHQADCRQSSQ